MSRVFRKFSIGQFGADTPREVVAAFEVVAQAIDQLTQAVNTIAPTRGQANSAIVSGQKAGNFDGVFLTGLIPQAFVNERFFHKLGRPALGAFELLTIPNVDEPAGQIINKPAAICIVKMDQNSIFLRSESANKVFTLIVF